MYDIKGRRLELGLTLEEVGEIVGVGKSTVRKWENGMIDNMKRDKIALLAKALHINPLELVYDNYSEDSNHDLMKVYNKLLPKRQEKVYTFAETQLEEQNSEKISSIEGKRPTKTEDTDFLVAAHMDDNLTDDEKEEINTYINKLIKKHKENGGDSD
ncbi:helix-turn-helix domain-containing protein [Aerococcus urinae]|uniref:helix-turn-helix domain-containing protein n=1 Tax=Aerococcus urinae TaxID=1376 RepID=UPI00254D2532|nr:helix-turn-helix transcriptional regulator [Aerococcus urinae]MDK7303479.1 helix-turn-helix transcriptional regulator [Aerococcus urinae]